jgi:hypothetical protein
VHVATDGESYGHHHRFGDMALAYALDKVESGGRATLTNYGEFLAKFPPQWKAEIVPNTSWSCAHGIERWRSDCGCNTGQRPEWNQGWRTPLRRAFDSLRDELAPLYEAEASKFFHEPWEARDGYIGVILDRSPEALKKFLQTYQSRPLDETEQTRALKLLEMQRHAMLLFTSCAWFFDDLAGIEALQNMQYAARAVQLAQELFGDGIEERFTALLGEAHSNEKGKPDGRAVYAQRIRTTRVDLPQVAAHYAISSVFEEYGDRTRIYCYSVERRSQRTFDAGRARLAIGRAWVRSDVTRESAELCYAMLHFGDQNFSVGVCPCRSDEELLAQEHDLSASFLRGDFPEVIRFIDGFFGGISYSLKSLFLDEQRKILNLVIRENLADAEALYSQLYEDHAPLMRFLLMVKMPLPKAFQAAAVVALNGQLRDAFETAPLEIDRVRRLLEQVEAAEVALDDEKLGFSLRQTINRLAADWYTEPEDLPRLRLLGQAVELAKSLPFWVDLWKVQNVYYEVLQTTFPRLAAAAPGGEKGAPDWMREFRSLGELLKVRIDDTSGMVKAG